MERNCQQEYVEDQQIISEENEENDGFEQIISENESEETIISEVHSNLNEIEPKTANGEFKTEFIFQFPNDNLKFEVKLEYDENGDLILPRKSHFPQTSPCKLTFFHLNQTSLENVGMQIWKGALLLSDFLIYKSELFKDQIILELGSGTGFCGIIAAKFAKRVYITENCLKNVEINQANWAKYPNSIKVNELDWEKGICYSEERMTQLNSPFNFSKEDIEEIKQTKIFLAADVIYDYFLTNSFFKLVDQLLSFQQDSILYLTVEKRINFCLEGHEFKVCSPFHQHFLTHLFAEKPTFDPKTGVTIPISPFHSRQIEINFPQYFNYERSDRLELWEITKRKKNSTMKKK